MAILPDPRPSAVEGRCSRLALKQNNNKKHWAHSLHKIHSATLPHHHQCPLCPFLTMVSWDAAALAWIGLNPWSATSHFAVLSLALYLLCSNLASSEWSPAIMPLYTECICTEQCGCVGVIGSPGSCLWSLPSQPCPPTPPPRPDLSSMWPIECSS